MKTTNLLLLSFITLTFSCSSGNNKNDASGIFEATEIIVSSQANGELLEFNIEEGMELKEGDFIGYVDTIQLHLKKQQLLGNLKSAESRHYNISNQISATQQQIATQKREQKRFENLVLADAANQKQLDDITAQLVLLERQLDAQMEKLEKGNQGVSGDAMGLIAQLAQIDDQIKKSIIKSPISGTVLTKYAEPNELATQGRSLFKIADVKTIKLRAYITADQLNSLKIGQQVKVFADQGVKDSKEYVGKVIWIAEKAEFTPKTIQTRDERANLVYAIKIAVQNDGYIKKGMYGDVKFN